MSANRTAGGGPHPAGPDRERHDHGLVRAYQSLDRALGGSLPPTRSQRFAARHPLGLGLGVGGATALLCLLAALDHPAPGQILLALGEALPWAS